MPCKDCGKDSVTITVPKSGSYFNKNLDIAEGALQAVWSVEANSIKGDRIKELIVEVQKLRSPYRTSFWNKLWSLRRASWDLAGEISCQYCRQHFYHDVIASIDVSLELEVKHYKHALRYMIRKESHKTYWLLQAIYHKIILNWIDLQKGRIRWYISKYLLKKNVLIVKS